MRRRKDELVGSRLRKQIEHVTVECILQNICLHFVWTLYLFNVAVPVSCLCHIKLTIISSQLFFVLFG